jgi:hypothetical protein
MLRTKVGQREGGEAQRAGIRDRVWDELHALATAVPAGSKRRSDWRCPLP